MQPSLGCCHAVSAEHPSIWQRSALASRECTASQCECQSAWRPVSSCFHTAAAPSTTCGRAGRCLAHSFIFLPHSHYCAFKFVLAFVPRFAALRVEDCSAADPVHFSREVPSEHSMGLHADAQQLMTQCTIQSPEHCNFKGMKDKFAQKSYLSPGSKTSA